MAEKLVLSQRVTMPAQLLLLFSNLEKMINTFFVHEYISSRKKLKIRGKLDPYELDVLALFLWLIRWRNSTKSGWSAV